MRICAFQHGRLEKVRNAFDAALADRADGKLRAGVIANDVLSNKPSDFARRHPPVGNAGTSRLLDVHDRLDVAHADAADLDNLGVDVMLAASSS